MTIRRFSAEEAKNFWLALERRPVHPPECCCDICLFFSQPRKPHYSRRTFSTAWFIHKIKMDDLIKNKKARRVKVDNEWRYEIDSAAYDKAPFRKKLREILDDVYHLTGDDGLIDPSQQDSITNYVKRSGAEKFIRFKDNLFLNRWLKTRPKTLRKRWKKNWESLYFCQRIFDFIRSRPGQEATQRELERHFSNKRKVEIERALKWLFLFPPIKQQKKGKSLIFSWKRLTATEIKTYNQRVVIRPKSLTGLAMGLNGKTA